MFTEEKFIHECLSLANNGRRNVGNGAMVGAVLVRENKIIAQGYHHAFGQRHAERDLLEQFAGAIEPEDKLYVSLEPCCHTGKNPPCTEAIIKRGIRNVVFGCLDPDPRVSGKGIETLRAAGVAVAGPVARASCEYFNRGFIALRTKMRPWITIKSARTKEGRIANDDGSPLKITDAEQDRWSHTYLRSRHDAILAGVGTIAMDDPLLNTRLVPEKLHKEGLKSYKPWRIILDPHLRIPLSSRIVNGDEAKDTIIVSAEHHPEVEVPLRARGVRIFHVPLSENSFAIDALWKALTTPVEGYSGIASILVEGGAKTWAFFREAGVVDEEVTLMGM